MSGERSSARDARVPYLSTYSKKADALESHEFYMPAGRAYQMQSLPSDGWIGRVLAKLALWRRLGQDAPHSRSHR